MCAGEASPAVGEMLGRALVIEPDEAYRATIDACMELAGCTAEHAEGLEEVVAALVDRLYDVIVWGRPEGGLGTGAEDIMEIRIRTDAPLVMLENRSDSAQRDLEAGADQWLSKPFDPGALVGVVRAAVRRSPARSPLTGRRQIGLLALDGRSRRVQVAEREVILTRQEWELLSILADHADRYLTVHEILHLGWHAGYHASDEVRTYVRRLRQKLGPLDPPCRLVSEHGRGYCLRFA
jgi:DNA-binding response OmpR family regulator